jgi:tetraacyldisaccharide 4'-kinase
MLQNFWFMLGVISKIFSCFVGKRNYRYDNGFNEIVRVRVPVISVGNLSVGGTGKTPMIACLAELLKGAGFRPGIVGRGYGKIEKGTVVVSDGKQIFKTALLGGDEMLMLARSCSVPVVADEIKSRAAKVISEQFDIDCIIVDDGFQHRRLARDLDIVLLDEKTLAKPFLIPKGRLREPLSSLKRADLICLPENVELTDSAKEFIRPDATVVRFLTQNKTITDMATRQEIESSQIIRANSIAFCGIANPERFERSLADRGISPLEFLKFSDHKRYSRALVRTIVRAANRNKARYIITTEKDSVKILEFADIISDAGLECLVASIETVLRDDNAIVNKLQEIIDSGKN